MPGLSGAGQAMPGQPYPVAALSAERTLPPCLRFLEKPVVKNLAFVFSPDSVTCL